MSALGPQFHGTTQETRGDTLLPGGGPHGRPNFAHDFRLLQHSRKGVFSTPSEQEAWRYASGGSGGEPGARPFVLRVQPSEDAAPGVHGQEYISSSAKVLERIDTKPGHQSTFPTINWNQFAKGYPRNLGTDTNHPSPAAVLHGHVAANFGGKKAPIPKKEPEDPAQGRLF